MEKKRVYREPICAPDLVNNSRWSKKCGKNNHLCNLVARAISLFFVSGDEKKCQPCVYGCGEAKSLQWITADVILLLQIRVFLFIKNLTEMSKFSWKEKQNSGLSSKMTPSCKWPITLDRRYTKVPEETGKSSPWFC